jgi:hypothetical protein
VSDRIAQDQIARLEASVGSDPGAPEFPALAEVLRGAGRLREAEGVARRGLERKPGCLEGGVSLALALLDQGRVDDARRELASRVAESFAARGIETPGFRPRTIDSPAGASGFDVEITERELERAFDAAEPDADQVVDADRVAQEAMRGADLELPEETPDLATDPVFATSTMAELLERQGDAEGASEIRATLEPDERRSRGMSFGDGDRREQIIATLENWLANLRREPR